jgi:hypothetical protein
VTTTQRSLPQMDPVGRIVPDQRELTRRAAERHAVMSAVRESRAHRRRPRPHILKAIILWGRPRRSAASTT